MTHRFPINHFLPSSEPLPDDSVDDLAFSPIAPHSLPTSDFEESSFSREEIQEIGNAVRCSLKTSVSKEKYNAYFEQNLVLESISLTEITFSVSTDFIRDMIKKQFLSFLGEAIEKILGKKYLVSVYTRTSPDLKQEMDNDIEHSSDSIPDLKNAKFTLTPNKDDMRLEVESNYLSHVNQNTSYAISIDPNKTFDTFIIGPSNNMAFATARAVSQTPGKKGNYHTLYIYSDSGLGKTHLLHAIANEIHSLYPSYVCCLTTAREFMKEMIHHVQHKKIDLFQKKYTEKIDILMIDDIHELQGKQGTQDEFFHIFNELHQKGKQLIFTSDKPPKEIDGIADRIKTRLQWGLVIDIQKPDYETRIAILKRKAIELDLFLHDDILALIATSVKSSIRELEGSLLKLLAVNDVMRVEIDIEMVKDILKLDSHPSSEKITLDSISKATAQYFKITQADLKSKTRKADIVRARHIAMFLSQKIIHATLKEIGGFYGGRDHTSVIHAIDRIKDIITSDTTLSHDVIAIEHLL